MARTRKKALPLFPLIIFSVLLITVVLLISQLQRAQILRSNAQVVGGGGSNLVQVCSKGADSEGNIIGWCDWVTPTPITGSVQGSYQGAYQGGYNGSYQGGYNGGYQGSYQGSYPTPTIPPTDLAATRMYLTDQTGQRKTRFKVNEKIYVWLVIVNQGNYTSRTSNGRVYSTFYKNRPNTITSYDVPSDPRNFYLDMPAYQAGEDNAYGSYPSHARQGMFPGLKYWTITQPGSYTARVFVDYDGRVKETNNFNNNQITVQYTVE